MHLSPSFVLFALFILFSCEKSFIIAPSNKRDIANDRQQKTLVVNSLPEKIDRIIVGFESLGQKEIDRKNLQVFPISYYLIPSEDAHFLFSKKINPRIENQLSITISGKKHFKYFVDPKDTLEFQVLKNAFHYISPEDSEFVGLNISGENAYYIWNRNNLDAEPFVISLKNKANTIKRSIAITKTLENYIDLDSRFTFLKESAGLSIKKNLTSVQKTFGEIIIREDTTAMTDKKFWLGLDQLILGANSKDSALFKILTKNKLTSFEFVNKFLIENFYNSIQVVAINKGIVFIPRLENLLIEIDINMILTGKFGFKHNNDIYPDIFGLIENKKPTYHLQENLIHFNSDLTTGRKQYFEFYFDYYLSHVINETINNLSKIENSITELQGIELKNNAIKAFNQLINNSFHLKIDLKSKGFDSKKLTDLILEKTKLIPQKDDLVLDYDEDLENFLEPKIIRNEYQFLTLNKKITPQSSFLVNQFGIFEYGSSNKILSFYLFNKEESLKFVKKKGFIKLLVEKNQ